MFSIRFKLVVALMALMLVPLIGAQSWMAWRMHRSHVEVETAAVERGLQRLLVAIDTELKLHEKLVNDWANWTEFAHYVQQPQRSFAEANLNPDALAAAGFRWIAVLDGQQRTLRTVSRDDTDPLAVLASPYGPHLLRVPEPGERGCGLGRWNGEWMALCRQGIRNSSGHGPIHGLLVVGEPLRADFAEHLFSLTGLRFDLSADPVPDLPDSRAGATLGSTLGQAAARLQSTPELVQAWWPVRDLASQPVGHLRLDWPRQALRQATDDLVALQWQLLGLFLLITLGLLVMLDRVVVRRLVRFSQELRTIHHEEAWHNTLTVDGRDEITQLARDTNNLLSLIQTQLAHLEFQAESDGLTGLPNRRSFDSTLRAALATVKRHHRPLCLVVLDVDHFKLYNDHYGHAQGDQALKVLGRCLLAQARRPGDLPARIGGEEFGVVLEDTLPQGAQRWIEAVQERLASLGIAHETSPVAPHLTLSAGIAAASPGDTTESLFRRADEALYQAKAQGRNRIVRVDERP